jgi:hypothetical protein
MGFRVQLIAVTGKEPHAVQRGFGVSATGQREEIAESPVVGAALPNGAYLLCINDPDRIVPEDEPTPAFPRARRWWPVTPTKP